MKKNIQESVNTLLTEKLKKYVADKADKTTFTKIYEEIFYTFVDLFQESNAKMSNEAVNLISQMYYDSIVLQSSAGPMELDPNIFDKRAKLEEVSTRELALLATMFRDTDYATICILEIKRRS